MYVWHGGYWGRHIGFYGGINYGYGYTGIGFAGGYWRSGSYYYNRSVTNVNVTVVHNTYNSEVVNKTVAVNQVSYNGGAGGIVARPTAAELAVAHEPHQFATADQRRNQHVASRNRDMLASVNNGQPSAATLAKHEVNYKQVKKSAHAPKAHPNKAQQKPKARNGVQGPQKMPREQR